MILASLSPNWQMRKPGLRSAVKKKTFTNQQTGWKDFDQSEIDIKHDRRFKDPIGGCFSLDLIVFAG